MNYQERLQEVAEKMNRAAWQTVMDAGEESQTYDEALLEKPDELKEAIDKLFMPLARIALELAAEEVSKAHFWRDDIEHYLQSQGLKPTQNEQRE